MAVIKNPRTEALAYRLWVLQQAENWELNTAQAARRLGVARGAVLVIARYKNWLDRMPLVVNQFYGDAQRRSVTGHSAHDDYAAADVYADQEDIHDGF